MIYEGKLYGKIGSRYIPLKMTSDDVDELKQRHTEICTRLQECVQKHQIGLGGEKIDQLVCDHIEAQASQIEAMLEAIQEAHKIIEVLNMDALDNHKENWPRANEWLQKHAAFANRKLTPQE
jgi:hypothetical protein